MSAELLREAAALMRSRAEAATWTDAPWGVDEIGAVWAQEADGQSVPISSRSTDENAAHIASWHPAVALAVADWLDVVSARASEVIASLPDGAARAEFICRSTVDGYNEAVNVARAYLGRAS